MTSKIRFIQYAIILLISANTVFADVKIKTRSTSDSASMETTTFIKGKRQRTEYGEMSVSIMQCDLRRTVQLSPAAKTYLVSLFNQPGAAQAAVTKTDAQTETTFVRSGTVTTIVTTKDTGERKQMFGYTARRIITTIENEPSPDACSKDKTKMEMDDWVIDADFAFVCNEINQSGYVPSYGGCQDKRITKRVGAAKSGYPIYSKITMYDENGKPGSASVSEVIELSKETLDAALFDVPGDYREVKNPSELYADNYSSGVSKNSSVKMPGGNGSSGSKSALNNSSGDVRNASNNSGDGAKILGAKKAGVVRLGLAGIKTGSVGEGVNAQELSAAVQNTLAEYLKMPNIEIVRLEAKLPQALEAEAKEKECDFVIHANVSHKKGGGGLFGKTLGKLSETVAGRAYGSADHVGKTTQITIMTAAAASGNVKAKDQITLEIKLIAAGSQSPIAAKQFQAKAKSDGEDIITQVVEQAAQMI
ncbi:MAG TPA: hypothetical protein VK308_13455, partial [Pyrinomonadaceae bacterium]|nr:hypothetical protein [Pyrinomonadaceae bacterium]